MASHEDRSDVPFHPDPNNPSDDAPIAELQLTCLLCDREYTLVIEPFPRTGADVIIKILCPSGCKGSQQIRHILFDYAPVEAPVPLTFNQGDPS